MCWNQTAGCQYRSDVHGVSARVDSVQGCARHAICADRVVMRLVLPVRLPLLHATATYHKACTHSHTCLMQGRHASRARPCGAPALALLIFIASAAPLARAQGLPVQDGLLPLGDLTTTDQAGPYAIPAVQAFEVRMQCIGVALCPCVAATWVHGNWLGERPSNAPTTVPGEHALCAPGTAGMHTWSTCSCCCRRRAYESSVRTA